MRTVLLLVLATSLALGQSVNSYGCISNSVPGAPIYCWGPQVPGWTLPTPPAEPQTKPSPGPLEMLVQRVVAEALRGYSCLDEQSTPKRAALITKNLLSLLVVDEDRLTPAQRQRVYEAQWRLQEAIADWVRVRALVEIQGK